MMKNWGVIGGIAAAMAAGVYVLWGPISDRKKKKKGELSVFLAIFKSQSKLKVIIKLKLTVVIFIDYKSSIINNK